MMPSSYFHSIRRSLFSGRQPMISVILTGCIAGFLIGYLLLVASSSMESVDRCQPTNPDGESEMSNRSSKFDKAVSNLQKDKTRLLTALNKEIRLLCWVMTGAKNDDRRAAIMETWGRRCDLILFMVGAKEISASNGNQSKSSPSTTNTDKPTQSRRKLGRNAYLINLNQTHDTYDNLWEKTRLAFIYIHEHYRSTYDWVLKVDDDSFVIVENLRLFLRDKKPEDPAYYGCQYSALVPRGYASGGPGYVMSQYNADQFARLLKSPMNGSRHDCSIDVKTSGAEDSHVGTCMAKLNVYPDDTRDELGRFRFLPFTPENVINRETLHSRYNWFFTFSAHKLKEGFECCSDSAISFHYISPSMIRVMEYLIYYVHPFSNRQMWANSDAAASIEKE